MKNLLILRFIIIAILLATFGAQSCVKDSNNFVVTYPGPQGNIKNIYLDVEKGIIPESFTINSNIENVVTTSYGMRISIPANSFINPSNNSVINGQVNISIFILTKKSEWVRFAQFSNTSGFLIDWYKTMSIQASYNGMGLLLSGGKTLTLQIPEENPSVNWKLINGEYKSERSFKTSISSTGYNYKTWHNDQGIEVKGLEFPINNLYWIGIGTIIDNPQQYPLLVNLPSNYRQINTAVIVVNPLDNVIYYLNNVNTSSSSFKTYLHTLKNLTLLVLSEQGNNTYFGSKDYYEELIPDSIIDKEPSQKSILEIEEYINAL